jgi:ribosome-binding factor A
VAHRISRASVTIQKELGSLISNDIKDPRLPDMVSVTRVVLAPDLSSARIYVSTPGDDEDRELAVEALQSAAGFLANELGARIKIRKMPRLQFVLAEDRKQSSRRDSDQL